MERKLLAVSIFAGLLGGCATTNDQAASESRDEGTYVTGSRLPQRTTGSAPVSQSGKEDWENATRGRQSNPQGK